MQYFEQKLLIECSPNANANAGESIVRLEFAPDVWKDIPLPVHAECEPERVHVDCKPKVPASVLAHAYIDWSRAGRGEPSWAVVHVSSSGLEVRPRSQPLFCLSCGLRPSSAVQCSTRRVSRPIGVRCDVLVILCGLL